MDDTADNTKYIAEQIYGNLPKPKNSINLQLEEETANIANNNHTPMSVFIENIIATITLHGVNILYGHRNILELNESQFLKINEYVESYGYTIIRKVNDNKLIISFKKIY